ARRTSWWRRARPRASSCSCPESEGGAGRGRPRGRAGVAPTGADKRVQRIDPTSGVVLHWRRPPAFRFIARGAAGARGAPASCPCGGDRMRVLATRLLWGLLTALVLALGVASGGAPAAPLDQSCAPRPSVSVAVQAIAIGQLQATITAQTGPGAPGNRLHALDFRPTNALLDVPGQPGGQSGHFVVSLPAGTQQTTFVIRQQTAGQATTVILAVTDDCGVWSTFVGGGPAAFAAPSPPTSTVVPPSTPTPPATNTATGTVTTAPIHTPTATASLAPSATSTPTAAPSSTSTATSTLTASPSLTATPT